MPHRWRAYKSLEWFIFIGLAMAAFAALVAVVMLSLSGRQARVVVIPAVPQTAVGPTPSPFDTASWQTYRNEELGFEIGYPPTYTHQRDAVFTQGELELSVITAPNTKNLSIQQWAEQDHAYVLPPGVDGPYDSATDFVAGGSSELSSVSVGGIQGLMQRSWVEGGYFMWRVFLPRGQRVFVITFGNYPQDGVERAEADFQGFLDHFHFIPPR